jgi:hypothetical protein
MQALKALVAFIKDYGQTVGILQSIPILIILKVSQNEYCARIY